MKVYAILVLLAIVVALSGCTSNGVPITVLQQGLTKYQFTDDIRDVLNVNVSDIKTIENGFKSPKQINIVFDGVSRNDNTYFQVAAYNLLVNLKAYYQNSNGEVPKFVSSYYISDENGKWFRTGDNKTGRPDLTEPTIWLKGPNTGATETSIGIKTGTIEKIVYLNGVDGKGIQLSGQRMVLLVMSINSLEDITKKGFQIVG